MKRPDLLTNRLWEHIIVKEMPDWFVEQIRRELMCWYRVWLYDKEVIDSVAKNLADSIDTMVLKEYCKDANDEL